MKSYVFVFVVGTILIVLLSAIWLCRPYYGVTEAVQDVTALNSGDELFIFIGHTKAVLKDNRFSLFAKGITSGLLVPETVNDDLLVAHFEDGHISKLQMKGIGHGGSSFVYHNQVYWYGGAEVGHRRTWKWNGSNFTELSNAEATALYGQIKDVDAVTRSEGWKELSLNRAQMMCQLRNDTIKIYEQDDSISNERKRMQIFLQEVGRTNPPEALIDVKWGYQEIGKAEYLKLKQQKQAVAN